MTHQSKNNSVVLGACLAIAIGVVGLLEATAWGQEKDQGGGIASIGSSISYQGVIKQGGTPINGTCDLQFSLWNALSGPSQVGPTNQFLSQSITNGLFVDSLDFGAGAFDGNDRWIEIAVRFPAGSGSYTTMTPRQKVNAVPYALFSLGGNSAFNLPYSGSANVAGPAFSVSNSNASGQAIIGSGNLYAVRGINTATQNSGILGHGEYGVYGEAVEASDWGVYGRHYVTGNYGLLGSSAEGVFGSATAPNGRGVNGLGNYGVWGESPNANGRGVVGVGAGTGDSTGVYGLHGPSGNYGKLGTSDSGVVGYHGFTGNYGALGTSGYGVEAYGTVGIYGHGTVGGIDGSTSDPRGAGVTGWNFATGGPAPGILGLTESTEGWAINGLAVATNGANYGVYGKSNSTSGVGVRGDAYATTGTNYGVIGQSDSTSGFDFYANGAGMNYGASSSKRWKLNVVNIDGPLDKLSQLRGVYFNWDAAHGGHHDVGMIAEEVGAVLPEIVQYEENGVDAIGMDYSKVTPLLVEAVNTLRAETNSQLQQRDLEIAALREANTQLEQRLAKLERRLAAKDGGGGQ